MMMTADVKRALSVSRRIQSELAGLGPDVQGAALADLVSLFFAGHNPVVREEAIANWTKAMRELIPESEKEIGKKRGDMPGSWWPS